MRPVAVQTGQTTECEIPARYNLHGAYKVFVTGEGVTAAVEEPKTPPKASAGKRSTSTLKVRFQAAADATLGVRDVRVATPQGASTLGQIVVVRDPIIREAAKNDSLQSAQAITLPATVCGAIEKAEDVDFYKFKVAAGAALTFHVRCQRLENRIHDLQTHADPILALRNASGTVLAANDNFFFGDPLLHYRFTTAGEYYLEIRDTRYGGNPYWQYCIEINDRPFVTCVHPLRVTPGKATRVRLIGHNLPAEPFATVTLPADTPEELRWTMLPLGGDKSNAVPIVVSRLPEGDRGEGKHGSSLAPRPSPLAPVPCGIIGCIAKADEVHRCSFEAKAGESFSFSVLARDYQSSLDSLLRIVNAKGQTLIENDDARDRYIHADSQIEGWKAPAAGRYTVEVRDLHGRGGESFVYFLKIVRAEPSFDLEIDTDKTLLSPGLASVLFVRAVRKNGFAGEIHLGVEGLPPGVTASCGRILAGGRDGCIILRAAADAKQAAVNLRVFGSAPRPDGKGKLEANARPLQEIYMPGGGRHHFPADMHTLSIGDPCDIQSMKIAPSAITLKPGESKRIDITITRRPGFKGNVTLNTVYQHLGTIYGSSMPPGVSIDDRASQTLLTGEQTKAHITLKAAADAKPVEKQQVPIMAHVSINFVMKWTCCGQPLLITVAKPATVK
ncbi:MAG TPA: PPC domain-containing protein [Gemmataceae bacterium]|nr:PPC domain-containing protein [Gemmataceae bacterium]